MFSSSRIQHINEHQYTSGPILYWAEGALRYEWNFGLEYAATLAKENKTSIIPLVTIDGEYAHDNIRQLVFLIESLGDMKKQYHKHKMQLSILQGNTRKILADTLQKYQIGALVASASYVRFFRDILLSLGKDLKIPVILIDDASLLPPWTASDHVEYGAYTLRKKYWKIVENLPLEIPEIPSVSSVLVGDVLDDILESKWYAEYREKIRGNELYPGGEHSAQSRWKQFRDTILPLYETQRNDPNKDMTSRLSPYLHFGCISPIQIFHDLRDIPTSTTAGFLEECFVRRELAINMWYYEKHPDTWECLPNWVIKTLDYDSQRTQTTLVPAALYTLKDLIAARTDDPLWNAAQRELMMTGKIHGYVRMYWGKQLLRWFTDWREGYRIGVSLNDRFAIDGCSPNGYTGIAWCFGKHDRPFPPKKIHYGLIRSMTLGGMKKKFDVASYIQHWNPTQ